MREPTGNDLSEYLAGIEYAKKGLQVELKINDAYNGEKYFVVGCNKSHAHEYYIYANNVETQKTESMKKKMDNATSIYTIDILAHPVPHRVGNFWNAQHTGDIPDNSFSLIWFENSPKVLFDNPKLCEVGMKITDRLLRSKGYVAIRTSGMEVGQVAGDNIREMFQKLNFQTMTNPTNVHGDLDAIWGQKI